MTRNLANSQYLDAADRKFISDVDEFGWHVTNVLQRKGETRPNWSFSCGLQYTFAHPEVIIFGLDPDTSTAIINEIGDQIKRGMLFSQGREYLDIFAKCGCRFQHVEKQHYPDYVGMALWFYEEDPFTLLQCCWPDRGGFYPWDERCDPVVRDLQPLLFDRGRD